MIDTPKARELDVVELTEDLPEYGLFKGARGTVVETFSGPEEAYMIEFLGAGGESQIADWVLPAQFLNLNSITKPLFESRLKAS
jgi:hypothetical protein